MSSARSFADRLASWGGATLLLLFGLAAATPGAAQPQDRVRVQLRWHHQAQFAGFYVALHKGFYARERVAVELFEGGAGINPVEVVAKSEADVAVEWLHAAVEARLNGRDVVNIAQIFRRPGLAIVCRRDAGVHSVDDIAGKTIGVWNIGDEITVRYWLKSIGVALDRVTIVQQQPDGRDLVANRTACGTVMMYNEYWSILRSGLASSDLLHVRLSDGWHPSLEDALYVDASSLADKRRRETLVRFLRATLAGWRYAAENAEEALAITMSEAPGADPVHQRRMLNSVLQLAGDPGRIGLLDLASYRQSVSVIADQSGRPAAVRAVAITGWTHRLWSEVNAGGRGLFALSDATRYYLTVIVGTGWFYALDLVGTVAFGLAGFIRAQQRRYDLWGALVLTLLPAVGGGTLRDLLVGGDRHPPFIFKDPVYAYIVLATLAIGTLLSRVLTAERVGSRTFERALAFFDTIGMAAFTVIGAQVAIVAGLNGFWVLFCAALTCAGGGMLLDIVTGREPRTFQGEPYEEIAVIGAVAMLCGLFVADRFEHEPRIVGMTIIATLVIVFTLRMLVIARGLRSYRLGTRPAA